MKPICSAGTPSPEVYRANLHRRKTFAFVGVERSQKTSWAQRLSAVSRQMRSIWTAALLTLFQENREIRFVETQVERGFSTVRRDEQHVVLARVNPSVA